MASTQQKDVNTALEKLIGTVDAKSEDAAFPGATIDVWALTAEVDNYIAPGGLQTMLCCAVLCCAVLCCAVLCFIKYHCDSEWSLPDLL